jgi:predicted phage-related endonuclease
MSGIDRELRQQGIGGSEAAGMYPDLHPYITPYGLAMRKRYPQAFETAETDWQSIGHFYEEPSVQVYSHLTGRKVRHLNVTYQHEKWHWVVFSPDAVCEDERRGLEIKVYADESRRFFGQHQDELPDYILAQCQWYMQAMDYPVWDVYVFLGGRPHIFTVWRDREVGEALIEKGREFVTRYVVGDELPPMDDPDAAERYLQWRYPTHRRPDLRIANEAEVAMLNEYAMVRQQAAVLGARKKILEVEIKGAIEGKEGLEFPDGRFTWRRCKDSQVTDWASLGLGLLNEHVEDHAKREEIIDFYTRTKPGTRRIHFKHKSLKEEEDE